MMTVNSFFIFRLSSQHLLVSALCREVYSASGNTVRTYSAKGLMWRRDMKPCGGHMQHLFKRPVHSLGCF